MATSFNTLLDDKYKLDVKGFGSADWYDAYKVRQEQEKAAKAEAAIVSSPQVEDTLLPNADSKDPNFPANFFSQDNLNRSTVDERRDRYAEWMKTQAPKFLTKTGVKQFQNEAALKVNRLGLVANAGLGEGTADVGISLGQGVIGSVESITSLVGADNPVSKLLREASDKIGSYKSQASKVDSAATSIGIDAANKNLADKVAARLASGESTSTVGAWLKTLVEDPQELSAYMKAFTESPAEMLAQGVGSFATLGIGKAAAVARTAQAARAGLGATEAAVAASKAARVTNVVVGAGQGVGAAKNAQYEQVEKLAREQGKSPADAATLAEKAQSYSPENFANFGAAMILGAVASGSGLETRLFRPTVAGKVVGAETEKFIPTVTKGFVKEAITEGAQQGQQQYAQNDAGINAKVQKESERYSGVAGSALQAGVVGGILGGAVDVVTRQPKARESTTTPPPNTPDGVKTESAPARAAMALVIQDAVASGDEIKINAALLKAEALKVFTPEELFNLAEGKPLPAETTIAPTTTSTIEAQGQTGQSAATVAQDTQEAVPTTSTVTPVAGVDPTQTTGEALPKAPPLAPAPPGQSAPTVQANTTEAIEERQAPPATMQELAGKVVNYQGITGTLLADGNTGGFGIIVPGEDFLQIDGGGSGQPPASIGIKLPTATESQEFAKLFDTPYEQRARVSPGQRAAEADIAGRGKKAEEAAKRTADRAWAKLDRDTTPAPQPPQAKPTPVQSVPAQKAPTKSQIAEQRRALKTKNERETFDYLTTELREAMGDEDALYLMTLIEGDIVNEGVKKAISNMVKRVDQALTQKQREALGTNKNLTDFTPAELDRLASGVTVTTAKMNKGLEQALADVRAYQEGVLNGTTKPAKTARKINNDFAAFQEAFAKGDTTQDSNNDGTDATGQVVSSFASVTSGNQGLTGTPANTLRTILNTQGVSAALDHIAKTTKSPFTKRLTGLLKPLIVDVVVSDRRPARVELDAAGSYEPTYRRIWVDDGATEATVMHEIIHAAVDTIMHTASDKLTVRQLAARGSLSRMYMVVNGRAELKGQYGLESIHEFIAEAMSNEEFQGILAGWSAKDAFGDRLSMWASFRNSVLNVLGMDLKIFGSSLDVTTALVEELFAPPTLRRATVLQKVESQKRYLKVMKPRWDRRVGESLTETVSDSTVKGKNQILDEMEATTNLGLKAALKEVYQRFALREVDGVSARIQKVVVDPVTDLIYRLSTANGMDEDNTRAVSGEYQQAKHALLESAKREQSLRDANEESEAMLELHEAAKTVIGGYEKDVTVVVKKIDNFYERAMASGWDSVSYTQRDRLVAEVNRLVEKVSSDLDSIGLKSEPSGKAATLIKRALTKHNYDARTTGDTRRMVEAARQFALDMHNMLGPKSAIERIDVENKRQLKNWLAAQANDRTVDADGRLSTFSGEPVPAGLRVVEAQQIIDNVDSDENAAVYQEIAAAYRDAFIKLTEEAVASGTVSRTVADSFYKNYPEYVNTQGKSDATEDTNFTESSYKAYLAPALGSSHKLNSNGTYANLISRSQKLAVEISNQKVGEAMYIAQLEGSTLFKAEAPGKRNKPYVKYYSPNGFTAYMTPTTKEGEKMFGKHPSADQPASVRALTKATTTTGRLLTQATSLFAPLNLGREILSRTFNFVGRKDDLVKADGTHVGITAVRAQFLIQALSPTTWAEAVASATRGIDSPAMKRFKESGGFQTFQKQLKTEADISRALANTSLAKVGGVIKALSNILHAWNQVFETTAVLASFKALENSGLSTQQAGFVTLDMMNFRQTGDITGKYLKPLFMFVNPTAQDALQFKRSIYNRGKINTRALIEISVLAASAAMLYTMMREADDDDEFGGKKMDSLTNRDRYNSFLIPLGGGKYTKLPIGFGWVQTTWQAGVASVQLEKGHITRADFFAEVFGGIVKNFSLTGGSEIEFTKDPLGWMMQTITPDLLAPELSIFANRGFTGEPIVGIYNKEKFASEQAKWKTPEAYKEASVWAREKLGFDILPEKIRVFAEGHALGPFAWALDSIVNVQADKELKGINADTTFSGFERAMGVSRIAAKTDGVRVIQTQFYQETPKILDLLKKYNLASPKETANSKETPVDKANRYYAAGASDAEVEKIMAYQQYETQIRKIQAKSRADYAAYKQGEYMNDEFRANAENEINAKREFLLAVKGQQ